MAFTRRKSLWGRQLAFSSSGYLIGSTEGSTDFTFGYLTRDSTGAILGPHYERITAASSSGAVLTGEGVAILSSATATDRNFTVPAPVAGIGLEILSHASATTILFETTAATIVFHDSTFLSTGSSALTIATLSTDGGNYGASVMLRGGSTLKWHITRKPKSSTAAV